MAQILIRGLRPQTVENWKRRAKNNNRSLEAEIRELIEQYVGADPGSREEAIRFADELRATLAGKIRGDSTDIIREYRDR